MVKHNDFCWMSMMPKSVNIPSGSKWGAKKVGVPPTWAVFFFSGSRRSTGSSRPLRRRSPLAPGASGLGGLPGLPLGCVLRSVGLTRTLVFGLVAIFGGLFSGWGPGLLFLGSRHSGSE